MSLTSILRGSFLALAAACAVSIISPGLADDATLQLAAKADAQPDINATLYAYQTIANKVYGGYVHASDALDWSWKVYEHQPKEAGKEQVHQSLMALLASLNDQRLQVVSQAESDRLVARRNGGIIGIDLRLQSVAASASFTIRQVDIDSPAEKAGLLVGDVVHGINNVMGNYWTRDEIDSLIAEGKEKVKFTVWRRKTFAPNDWEDVGLEIEIPRDPLDHQLGIDFALTDPEVVQQILPEVGDPPLPAGLVAGDLIIAVGDQRIDRQSSAAVASMFGHGLLGEKVRLTIIHTDPATHLHSVKTVSVARDVVPDFYMHADRSGQHGGLGADFASEEVSKRHNAYELFAITNFDLYSMGAELDDYLRNLHFQGDAGTAIIDLRGAKGNDPDLAAIVLSRFIKNGELFKVKTRVNDQDAISTCSASDWRAVCTEPGADSITFNDQGEHSDDRLVVIVDSETAGTAKAFAYAIQANHRGKVVGWPTSWDDSLTKVKYVDSFDHGMAMIVMSEQVQVPFAELLGTDGKPMSWVRPDYWIPTFYGYSVDFARWIGAGASGPFAWLTVYGFELSVALIVLLGLLLEALRLRRQARRKSRLKAASEKTGSAGSARQETTESISPAPASSASLDLPKPKRKRKLISWLPLATVICVCAGYIALDTYNHMPPSGTSLHLQIVALNTGSAESNLQIQALRELATEYKGDIEFRVVASTEELKEDPKDDLWGWTIPTEGILISAEYRDGKGKRFADRHVRQEALLYRSKRELVKFIAMYSQSINPLWPDARVERVDGRVPSRVWSTFIDD